MRITAPQASRKRQVYGEMIDAEIGDRIRREGPVNRKWIMFTGNLFQRLNRACAAQTFHLFARHWRHGDTDRHSGNPSRHI